MATEPLLSQEVCIVHHINSCQFIWIRLHAEELKLATIIESPVYYIVERVQLTISNYVAKVINKICDFVISGL